jgi:two-component system nitrogen regulation response regulator NtrX
MRTGWRGKTRICAASSESLPSRSAAARWYSGLRAQVLRIAQHDAPVLIFGEPGTGKEVYARFLHAHSPRRAGPFIDVGVGSIARENASLELFGSEQGDRVHYGRLEQASGGTLFLDELADMDLEAQAKLASALENGSFLRIGGKEPVRVNVRVAAATHRDLEQEVAVGRFSRGSVLSAQRGADQAAAAARSH